MTRYIIRRCLGALFVVWIVSIVTFVVFQLVPVLTHSSPAYLYTGRTPSQSQIKAVEHKFGLDKPIPEQYGLYMWHIVHGQHVSDGVTEEYCPPPCFGYSYRLDESVWPLIKDRFSVTLSLAIGAATLWLFGGVAIGVLSALRRGSFLDRASMVGALVGVSSPVYFTGLVLLSIFSYGPIKILPNVLYVAFTDNPISWARNLLLPWISLAFLYAALYARLTRSNMIETMGEDYIRTATAKGLPRRTVVFKHGLRAALTPIVTIFGLDLGSLLGGAILTEKTFSLHGLGALSIDAISKQDLPVIMGVTIIASLFIVFANVIVDILYAVIDPRVRYS
jgi:peptide/nickel transport system permease protein